MKVIEISRSRDMVKITTPEHIDLRMWHPLRDLTVRTAANDDTHWVFDLSQSQHIQDSGLALLQQFRHWIGHKADMQLKNGSVHVTNQLQSAGLI